MLFKGTQLWKQIVDKTVNDFGSSLAINDICITINGCLSNSDAMNALRRTIKAAADEIRVWLFLFPNLPSAQSKASKLQYKLNSWFG